MRFEYVEREVDPPPGQDGTQTILEPIVVRVIGPTRAYLIRGLLDTGASETILPLHYAERLGVPRGDHYLVGGASGATFPVWLGQVDLELHRGRASHRWSARVGFTTRRNDLALLGHAGFLDHFIATFDGGRRRVTLRPVEPLPDPLMSLD